MTPTRPYDDLGTPAQMGADCRATLAGSDRLERAARRALAPAPSIHYDEQPAEQPKPTVEVSTAAARIAAALHFHLE